LVTAYENTKVVGVHDLAADSKNTQKTVAKKVKNLCTEEKLSFAYLCICVQANKLTAISYCAKVDISLEGCQIFGHE
jgi:hypothetical protein